VPVVPLSSVILIDPLAHSNLVDNQSERVGILSKRVGNQKKRLGKRAWGEVIRQLPVIGSFSWLDPGLHLVLLERGLRGSFEGVQ